MRVEIPNELEVTAHDDADDGDRTFAIVHLRWFLRDGGVVLQQARQHEETGRMSWRDVPIVGPWQPGVTDA